MDSLFSVFKADSSLGFNKFLGSGSVRCCVTSPPYWALRDYGCGSQLGREETPDEYVGALVNVFSHVWDVLADDGTLWVNIGDTYAGTGHKGGLRDPKFGGGRNGQSVALNNKVAGCKRKDLVGVPWLFAFAMRDAGWFLRSDVIWEKPNALPSPVRDRPVSSFEHVFMFSKKPKYFYDCDAVKVDAVGGGKRSLRDVWHINTQPLRGNKHVAVFPDKLVEPCVLAGSEVGDVVFDPFCGSGTTGIVANRLGRRFVGVESNPEYVGLALGRLGDAAHAHGLLGVDGAPIASSAPIAPTVSGAPTVHNANNETSFTGSLFDTKG